TTPGGDRASPRPSRARAASPGANSASASRLPSVRCSWPASEAAWPVHGGCGCAAPSRVCRASRRRAAQAGRPFVCSPTRRSAEQQPELGLDLGLEPIVLALAAEGLLALAAELRLDLLDVDPVCGRGQLLQGPNVLFQCGGGEGTDGESATLVEP